ncbi:carbohydrate ABC transporter membrane protein 2 (CUT1 family) [Lacrimispora xylanisolvens]|uniref:Carbohydrate ABC transporter membrane protein 2 (CUT1 family) n=1 Tax=Lacrimispora xylanisolvens TaxID=384636 RepID=A0A2S6HS85_9FIRM|nr:carbohydrate ABC transporter permease [Hungatella xylanolytica]MBE5985253.1 carbohydrate ABC transporter permease [Paenibacillaceae bacterium]MBE5986335.1 carbohydrate ABC transporter permease [Paenibacillaceae bacterium]PPK80546.1 carbohydrate ABC transporter membrane protein 2 (CUT1 family) [Hungatella xylanolytica]
MNKIRVSKKKAINWGTVINYLLLTILVVICFYPFLNVVAYSFSSNRAVLSGTVTFFPIEMQLDAYKEIVHRGQIWTAMRVTMVVTMLGTAIGLILTVFAAYALSKDKLKGRRWISGMILFTMYFNGGIIPTFLVIKNLGMYDQLTSLYIPSAVNVFNFIVMRTFFREIPKSLEEAAYLDGATDVQILFKIVLPLSMPIIATIGLFYAVYYWNDYFNALIYIQSPEKYTLQLRLRSLLFAGELGAAGNEGLAQQVMAESLKMACIVVGTVPILAVYPWLQKYFVKGVMLGSVKG